jgi:hypothetical protein
MFALISPAQCLALKKVLPVGRKLKLGDEHVAGMNGHRDSLPVAFFFGIPLNMNAEALPVHSNDLASVRLVLPADHNHLVPTADRHRADFVLIPQFFAQVRTHQLSAHTGRSREISLSGLATGAAHRWILLHPNMALEKHRQYGLFE